MGLPLIRASLPTRMAHIRIALRFVEEIHCCPYTTFRSSLLGGFMQVALYGEESNALPLDGAEGFEPSNVGVRDRCLKPLGDTPI